MTSINKELWDGAGQLRKSFDAARPFRHVILENFLDEAFCQALIDRFPRFDPARTLNERGERSLKAAIPDLARLGGPFAQFDALIRSPEFLHWTGRVTGIPNLLYDPDYVGGGTHENLDGQDLDPHVDFNYHPARRWHRRLNLIVFLNPRWEPGWGGCLELLADPWASEATRASATVVPLANRAVIFETNEHSWHGFDRIDLPSEAADLTRKSIAVYFYTRERPSDSIAAPHQTVYVPRPLSGRLQSGYTLTERDIAELNVLIQRRDTQLKFLYDREKHFGSFIDGLVRSPSFRIGHALTWPARTLRKLLRGIIR